MINDLSRFITNYSLQKLAGQRYYQRGRGYFENGYVGSLTEREFSISAAVSGTYRYQVKLWIDGKIGKLKYS